MTHHPVRTDPLEIRPYRSAEWEESSDGRIILLVPKFRNKFLARWVLPHLASQHFRVTLDDLGSAVWRRCDGVTSVGAMGEEVRKQLGNNGEPLQERVCAFVRKMEKGDLLKVLGPE